MFWNKRSFRTMGFTWLALLLFTATALAGQKDLGESGGSAACERMIHLSKEAEKQLGGTLYSGPLPEQGEEAAAMSGMEMKMPKENEGMQMSGKMPGKEMKMPNEKEGMQMSGKMPLKEMKMSEEKGGMQMAGAMPGVEGAHMEHEAKVGGTFFMAPTKCTIWKQPIPRNVAFSSISTTPLPGLSMSIVSGPSSKLSVKWTEKKTSSFAFSNLISLIQPCKICST